jgi:hypothetical protein
LVQLSDKWNVPVPDEYRQQATEKSRAGLLRVLDERKQAVEQIEQSLAALDGKAD